MSLLQTRQAMEAYKDHAHSLHPHNPASHTLSPHDTTVLAVDVFQRLEDDLHAAVGQEGGEYPVARQGVAGLGLGGVPPRFYINGAVELTACWIRDVFDR